MRSFKRFLIESIYNDNIFNYSGMQSLPLETMGGNLHIDRLLSVANNPTKLHSDILTGSKDEAMAALNHPDLGHDLFLGFFSRHEDVAHATLEHGKLNWFTKIAALQSPYENVAYRVARWGGLEPRDALQSRHEFVAHYGLDQLPDRFVAFAFGSPHESVRERARQILSMDE